MRNRSNRVLVFGNDSRVFLTVARSFGRQGIEVHVVPFDPFAPALKSRYVHKVHVLPVYDGSDRWIDALEDVLRTFDFDLTIPCCDRAILCLNAHIDRLSPYRVAFPNKGVLESLFDKHATRQVAKRLGIPLSPGRLIGNKDDPRTLSREFGWPLIIKERRSYRLDDLSRRGSVAIVRSRAELERLFGTMVAPNDYLVEAHVEGAGVGVSVIASRGRILCAFQHRRLKEPNSGGSSSLRMSEKLDPRLLDACRAIVRDRDMTGVAMFEFRVNDRNGQWVLLEVNARFWGSLPLPVALGVDFPMFLYRLMVDGKEPQQVVYAAGAVARNLILNAYDIFFRNSLLEPGGFRRTVADVFGLLGHPLRAIAGREISDTFQKDDLRPALLEFASIPLFAARQFSRNLRVSRRLPRASGFVSKRPIHS